MHHGGEVDDRVGAAHGCRQGLRATNVSPVDVYPALLEPGRVLAGQREYPHAFATVE